MARPSHKSAHPTCPNGATTWVACDQAEREKIGRCRAMTESANECTNWAIDRVNDRAYCGQHLVSVVMREDRESRAILARQALDGRIERYLAWTAGHPSVWDRMPSVTEPLPKTPAPAKATGVLWRASDGGPAPRR